MACLPGGEKSPHPGKTTAGPETLTDVSIDEPLGFLPDAFEDAGPGGVDGSDGHAQLPGHFLGSGAVEGQAAKGDQGHRLELQPHQVEQTAQDVDVVLLVPLAAEVAIRSL